ncbi:hypothetical protein BH20VER1_BH20VER1_28980 [soil metagenome]
MTDDEHTHCVANDAEQEVVREAVEVHSPEIPLTHRESFR